MGRINHLAVLVSAIAVFLLGWVWYSLLFQSIWLAAEGLTAMKAPSPTFFIGMFVLGWILAYAVAMAIAKAPRADLGAGDGAMFGIFSGVGFFAVPLLMGYYAEGRPLSLWLINAGYIVASMIAIGVIVTSWKSRAVQTSP